MTRPALALTLGCLLALPPPAASYLKLTAPGGLALRWSRMPVRYFVADRGVPGVSALDLRSAVDRAVATWEAVPTASVTFQFAGFTGSAPFQADNLPVLGFENRPDLERVLGATRFVIDIFSGDIVESDIFFNSNFAWSTASAGEAGRFDLESVALHEIGHFIGLGHSALGETEVRVTGGRRVLASGAVMFPISFGAGNTADRQLQPDDIAGVSDVYPDANFRQTTGAARGRVSRNGQPVFGAHVVTFNPETGKLIGGFSINEDGQFEIAGLTPGPHVIRVEPLDDADIDSFFTSSRTDIDFQVTFHDRLFVAPKGGVGERFDVRVRPK
jgi:hypothetical protein